VRLADANPQHSLPKAQREQVCFRPDFRIRLIKSWPSQEESTRFEATDRGGSSAQELEAVEAAGRVGLDLSQDLLNKLAWRALL
jgi:hypothetical protein